MNPPSKYQLVYFGVNEQNEFRITAMLSFDVLPMDTIGAMLDTIDEYTQVSIMERRHHPMGMLYYQQIFHISRIP